MIVPLSMPVIALPLILSGGGQCPHAEASGDVGRFATPREKFANWLAVSNRNGRLALALVLLLRALEVSRVSRRTMGGGDP